MNGPVSPLFLVCDKTHRGSKRFESTNIGEPFSLSPRERAGVRGNGTPKRLQRSESTHIIRTSRFPSPPGRGNRYRRSFKLSMTRGTAGLSPFGEGERPANRFTCPRSTYPPSRPRL